MKVDFVLKIVRQNTRGNRSSQPIIESHLAHIVAEF